MPFRGMPSTPPPAKLSPTLASCWNLVRRSCRPPRLWKSSTRCLAVVGQCLDANTCFDTDDYIVSVTYVGESSSGDQFVENYRVFFSPVPPEELQVAQSTSTECARSADLDLIQPTGHW